MEVKRRKTQNKNVVKEIFMRQTVNTLCMCIWLIQIHVFVGYSSRKDYQLEIATVIIRETGWFLKALWKEFE